MDSEQLQQLVLQPEGLKLDFKHEFYQVNSTDPKTRERQWGELTKDILALANANVNIAGETGYLIFGVGDSIRDDGTRELFDVGLIKATRQQILDRVNAACAPVLPDILCDLLLLDGHRIFVISIPPSPYLHETTRMLETSSGRTYPEHTVFIRRGEGTHTASLLEAQAILAEKQRIAQEGVAKGTAPASDLAEKRSFIDVVLIVTVALFAVLVSIWSYKRGMQAPDDLMGLIVGVLGGFVIGLFFAGAVKLMYWLMKRRPSIRRLSAIALWAPVVGFSLMGVVSGEDFADSAMGVVAGASFGLVLGAIFVAAMLTIGWIAAVVNSKTNRKSK